MGTQQCSMGGRTEWETHLRAAKCTTPKVGLATAEKTNPSASTPWQIVAASLPQGFGKALIAMAEESTVPHTRRSTLIPLLVGVLARGLLAYRQTKANPDGFSLTITRLGASPRSAPWRAQITVA